MKAKMKCFLVGAFMLVMHQTFTLIPALAESASNLEAVAEKPNLKIGFIKLTDMAPLAVAQEKGFFLDEGLSVSLEAQSNWKILYDRLAGGELDAAHMLAAMPIGSMLGITGKTPIISPMTLSYNGAGITLSNALWQSIRTQIPMQDGKPTHPISAKNLKMSVDEAKASGGQLNFAMTFPVGTHNYILRYWLAEGGIHPGFYDPTTGDNSGNKDSDVLLSVVPPPQMVATMQSGTTAGYCVGEPWNEKAVAENIGTPVLTSDSVWDKGADKVLGITQSFAESHPNTTLKLVKAIIRASYWLDENNHANRAEAAKIISAPHYVGADEKIIAQSMLGHFEFEKGDLRDLPNFNIFYGDQYGVPYYSDAIWWLTQMRRWGQIPETKTDTWYLETAKSAFKPEIYAMAAKALIAEGKMQTSQFPDFEGVTYMKPAQKSALDNITYDGNKPNEYLNSFSIGKK